MTSNNTSNNPSTRTVLIDLDDSRYARSFTGDRQLHQPELEQAMNLIREQLDSINDRQPSHSTSNYLEHRYRTIGVFGDRGSGKTSFLISLLEECGGLKGVEILPVIDPTLVEHKKPIVLSVLSMIHSRVKCRLDGLECSPTSDACLKRRAWEEAVRQVAEGITAIEGVGKDYDNTLWQDEEYVLYTGLDKVGMANRFERNLRRMVSEALEILGKRAFLMIFDDIDVDMAKGWEVLETLRRYLSDDRLVTVVSGNFRLYEALVRHEMSQGLPQDFGEGRTQMVNELESQYMLKLLDPSRRIHLSAPGLLLQEGHSLQVRKGQEEKPLTKAYQEILNDFGITDAVSVALYTDFLLSMSLRSQICFLADTWQTSGRQPSLDVFTSRLHAAGIDSRRLLRNVQLKDLDLLAYLLRTKGLSETYLLLPTQEDKDLNSNLTAFTLLLCRDFRQHPGLLFDYLLRIAYVRNVTYPFHADSSSPIDCCRYAGWDHLMSLKNCVGLTIAYVASKGLDLKEHLSFETGRPGPGEGTDDDLSATLRKISTNPSLRLIALLPYVRIAFRQENTNRNFYSLPVLLGVIGEVLKCRDKENLGNRLHDLGLFRTFQTPLEKKVPGTPADITVDTSGAASRPKEEQALEELTERMWTWKGAYKDSFLPPYAIGRIMTRLYAALRSTKRTSLGQTMSVMVANLFQACLLEETRIRLPEGKYTLDYQHLQTDTKGLTDNLSKSNHAAGLPFTRWIMACPLLNCFLDEETYNQVQQCVAEELRHTEYPGVYELLNQLPAETTNDNGQA